MDFIRSWLGSRVSSHYIFIVLAIIGGIPGPFGQLNIIINGSRYVSNNDTLIIHCAGGVRGRYHNYDVFIKKIEQRNKIPVMGFLWCLKLFGGCWKTICIVFAAENEWFVRMAGMFLFREVAEFCWSQILQKLLFLLVIIIPLFSTQKLILERFPIFRF